MHRTASAAWPGTLANVAMQHVATHPAMRPLRSVRTEFADPFDTVLPLPTLRYACFLRSSLIAAPSEAHTTKDFCAMNIRMAFPGLTFHNRRSGRCTNG
jgi:hypothetical protein